MSGVVRLEQPILPRAFLSCAALVLFLALSGCSTFKRSTTGSWARGQSLGQNPSVLVVPLADVVEKGEGQVGGSGADFTSAIRDTLLSHGVKVTVGEPGPIDQAVASAAAFGYAYVLRGAITRWEDNATEWSGNPDRAGLSLELYDVTTKQLVATGSHQMAGSSGALVPLTTYRFVPELVDHSLARIFGWRPRVWY